MNTYQQSDDQVIDQLSKTNFFRQLAGVQLWGVTDLGLSGKTIRMDWVNVVLNDNEEAVFKTVLADAHRHFAGTNSTELCGITNTTIIERMFALHFPDYSAPAFDFDQFQDKLASNRYIWRW